VLELRVNGLFVMDSWETSTEVALAQRALHQVEHPRSVLVGGLGLGHTVIEVLGDVRVEHVLVAEIEEALVRWFRDGTVQHGLPHLADARLSITVADVQQAVAEAPRDCFDLVLLDVDNGPAFLVYDGNATIYEPAFLRRTAESLRPGGVVAVWSSTRSPELERALTEVFGESRTEECPVVLQGRDDSYWLHSARKSETHDQQPSDRGER
jgi:spermidine synthase